MKIQISDSFVDSLKVLARQNTWWYKIYKTLRWDLKNFVLNVWTFRKELWDHRWWDYRYTLNLFEKSLHVQEKGLSTRGIEVPESRDAKVQSIRRVLELLKNAREDNFIERAEAELGPLSDWDWNVNEDGMLIDKDTPEQKAHNRKVFVRARQIEDEEWKELWNILKGTKNSRKFNKNYDGSDMRGWWD